MTHTYNISGMTCEGCSAKVTYLLRAIHGVNNVAVNHIDGQATIDMREHIPLQAFQDALKDYPKYNLTESTPSSINIFQKEAEAERTWLQTYKPILLLFGYITVIALIAGYTSGNFSIMIAMRVFMAGFFLAFSFFKLLDIKAFAQSYAMYDVIAKKFKGWGYVYALLELVLGFAFATNFEPLIVNIVTATVMTISLIGVLQTVIRKQKIQCACLGAVFNLPMSTVTIFEDVLMIVMSIAMLLMLF